MLKIIALLLVCTGLSRAQHPSGQVKYRSIPLEAGIQDADADLEVIRAKVIADILSPPVDKSSASRLVRQFSDRSTWPGINYDDVSRTGFEHRRHLDNILLLVRAYKQPGTDLYQNNSIYNVIEKALEFWLAHDFICDNWWWNEMGTPNYMISILLVMDGDLPESLREPLFHIAGRANMKASGARPGGDLIQVAAMRGKQALYRRNAGELKSITDILASEIKTTTGRGMKPDLSFHHRTDNVISTLTYGTGYTNSFAYWAVKTAGTGYALPESALKLLIDHFLDGICASMAFGRYPDPGARNRELSRENSLAPVGPALAVNLLKSGSYRKEELEEIVKSRQGRPARIASHSRFFWHSEYFTFQRPGYFASVRMHSSRNHNMEQPHNEEGLKNHHFADGSSFLIRHGLEYNGISPVWDWQKIPGTTVVQKPVLPHWREIARKGKNSFTGGVTDGHYGAAAFDFASVHDPLKARKAWFFFDNEYLCLGSGITSGSDYPVTTTLEQRLLNGKVTVIPSEGSPLEQEKGTHLLENVKAVVHDNTGYLFFQPQSVRLSNTVATGSWRAINHQSWATDKPVEKETFTLWIDHGLKPAGASYAYQVIPGFTVDQNRVSRPVSVLANTGTLQAVWHEDLQILQAVFYHPGKLALPGRGEIESAQPCMVMLQFEKDKIKRIAVSDPSRNHIKLDLKSTAQPAGRKTGSDNGLDWKTEAGKTTWDIALPIEEMAGESVTLSF